MPDGFTVDVIAQTTKGLAGNAIAFPAGEVELETHLVEMEPGAQIGRHKHPSPCLMYVLEGRVAAELGDGNVHHYEAGQVFIEDRDTWVNNINAGDTAAKFLAVVVGSAGNAKIDFES